MVLCSVREENRGERALDCTHEHDVRAFAGNVILNLKEFCFSINEKVGISTLKLLS